MSLINQVSEAIMFEDCLLACLKHLGKIPWTEEEEEKVVSAVTHFHPRRASAALQVLQRVSVGSSTSSSQPDGIISRLLIGVLHAKDEKARREMKGVLLKLLREDGGGGCRITEEREAIYNMCHKCISSLLVCLPKSTNLIGEVAREATNLLWLVEILISKGIGEEFVVLWADQKELAAVHSNVQCVYRFEISRITSLLCVAIGRGQVLVPRDTRFSLLNTWLDGLYSDFRWMKRDGGCFDRKIVENGLSQTILTLTMAQQQTLLLNWFERFLNQGDDCPNIHCAFEIWWRRAFVRQHVGGRDLDSSQLQIAVCDHSS